MHTRTRSTIVNRTTDQAFEVRNFKKASFLDFIVCMLFSLSYLIAGARRGGSFLGLLGVTAQKNFYDLAL